jgi:hypothetical protein
VDVLENAKHLEEEVHHFSRVELPPGVHDLGERFTLYQLHYDQRRRSAVP